MPSFMKDEMKKKDEEKLEEMQKEIDQAEAEDQESPVESQEAEATEETETLATESLEAKIAELEVALKEKEDRVLRLQADFDNFRRRSRQEKEELRDVIVQNLLKEMLPLLDNFERALSAENADLASLKSGVEMIYKELQTTLTKEGLEVIETAGVKFDPNFHQAVMRVEDPEKEDDTIESELQRGYKVKGRVIRPSMVQVVSN